MKRPWTRLLTMALLVVLLAIAGRALAQGGGYTLIRAVSQSSGVIGTQNRDYQLVGVIGQPIAGAANAQNMRIGAGYWYRSEQTSPTGPTGPTRHKVFLPTVRR